MLANCPARVGGSRARRPGQSPLDALREHVLDGLRRRDPITGLNDAPQPLALLRMVTDTPSLAGRVLQYLAAARTHSPPR